MKLGIHSFTLKIIAISTMLIDHIGTFLFPELEILRIIGRISYPIFAFLLVEGFLHTHNLRRYVLRMGIVALISEIPFDLAVSGQICCFSHQNIFFTLVFGLAMLFMLQKVSGPFLKAMTVVLFLAVAELLHFDYGYCGMLMIFLFYIFAGRHRFQFLSVAFVNVFLMGGLQSVAILAMVPLSFYDGEEGPKCKWFFYSFYPVHLAALYGISLLI